MVCTPSADDRFGPAVHGCRHDFDFTLLFEQSFLQIAPCAILLLLVPLRAKQLSGQSVKTLRTGVRLGKQAAISILAATQLTLLIAWTATPVYRTKASIPAATLGFLAALALFVLSSIEHTRSVRPSSVINTYIFFSSLFDVPQARTLWLRAGPRSIPAIFTAGIGAKILVLILEARNKRLSLFPQYRLNAPEVIVSLYDRTVLWWLNPLLFSGYKGLINLDKLQAIDADLLSERTQAIFRSRWLKARHSQSKRPLLFAILVALKDNLLAIAAYQLCVSAFKLCQPLLINRVTALLSGPATEQSEHIGVGLICATVLIYVGLSISTAMRQRQLHRLSARVRCLLIDQVHSKALLAPSDQVDDGALTFVTADVERIMSSVRMMPDMFGAAFEIGVAVFLLKRQIGSSCLAPVAISALVSAVSLVQSGRAVDVQKAWLAAVQTRVAYIASVLQFPKSFKMLGLCDHLSTQVQALRVVELQKNAQFRQYVTWRNVLGNLPETVAPPLTLTTFTLLRGGAALTTVVAFTSLSLVSLLTHPMHSLIHGIPLLQTVLASLDRIQEFLLIEELPVRADFQDIHHKQALTSAGDIELTITGSHQRTGSSSPLAVKFTNVTVLLGQESNIILNDINAEISRGTCNMIVGPVGCGKSTFLKVLIGEVQITGSVKRLLDCAYCAQNPWLPNDTVQNIILGESTLDQAWYATVVDACALRADIIRFPQADETVIGSKGVSLSGGQRQRLALARALYARKTLLVLDDVLSGLDATTSTMVFQRVLGQQGLCKWLGTTVVFATHAVQFLRDCDNIIVLDQSGSIAAQGPFESLEDRRSYVHELSRPHSQCDNAALEEGESLVRASPVADKLAVAHADLARRTGDIAVYKYYLKSVGPLLSVIVLATSVGDGFFATFPSVWVQRWAEAEDNGAQQPSLGRWYGIYFLFASADLVMMFSTIWIMLVTTVPRSAAKLHQQLLTAVMRAPHTFFTETDAGVTINRFSNDMSIIEGEMSGAILQTLGGSAACLASAALIALGAAYAALTIPFVLIVLYCVQRFYLRTSRQLRYMELETQAPLLAHCSETFAGVATIRAFGWQRQSHEKCARFLDDSQRPFYLMLCIQRWLRLVLDLTTAAIAVVVVSMAVTLRSSTSAGLVGVSLLNILGFSNQLSTLVAAWTTLETSMGAVARCKNFEQSTVPEDLPSETDMPPPSWPSQGSLELEGVQVAYKPNVPDALHAISLTISAGEKIGICGRTGSGKSTFLLALLRLLTPHTGRVILDGIDLATIPRETLRQRVTAVPQEALIVPDSVRVNLDPMRTCSDDAAMIATLQRVGLAGIIAERGGLDVMMTELNLSQGQLQLFAIARAILRKSKVVLLDEMSSSVDVATEEQMVRLVREEFADSTVIAVAHRLKTIMDFDCVVVMDAGRIVEVGKPAELLRKDGGAFRSMWERSH